MEKYYIMINGEQQGPFTAKEIEDKGFPSDSFIYNKGLGAWKKISEVTGFLSPNTEKDIKPEDTPKLTTDKSDFKSIKKEVGTAVATNNNTYAVKGRDLRSGTPKEVNITEEDSSEALDGILRDMVNGIKDALENTPPELSADLVDMGLTLTGGGALLKNIDKRFSKETGLPVHIAEDPLACVAIGIGKALENEEVFSPMLSEY